MDYDFVVVASDRVAKIDINLAVIVFVFIIICGAIMTAGANKGEDRD